MVNFDELCFTEFKDELEEILGLSDFKSAYLKHDVAGSPFIKSFEKLRSETTSIAVYFIVLMHYARSPFRRFEIYLRLVVGLDGIDIQIALKEYNSILLLMKYLHAFNHL